MTRFSVTVRVDEHSELCQLLLAGDLDFEQVDRLVDTARTGLADVAIRRIVLDLRDVTFIDSSGVGALISVRRMARAGGRTATLRNVGGHTAEVLRIAAIDQVFDREPGH
jgi:anti-anti-sigma factor